MSARPESLDLIAFNFNIEKSDFFATLRKAAQPSPLGESYLHTLAREGDALTLELLLADGADPDHADGLGRRPLHEAARCGHADIARLLLAAGARCDSLSDPLGVSALMQAVENGHLKVAALLLDSGANLSVRNRLNGQGLLHLAAAKGDLPMIGLLVSRGAGVFLEDKAGQTPRDHAARRNHRAAELCLMKIMAHQARYLH